MVHRVLSLDGGGAWALLQAMCLKDLMPGKTGHEILAQFDLVAANSGGSIVLGGLIENMTPDTIIDLFLKQENRKAIFQKLSFFQRLLSKIPIFPKYSTAGKLEGLRRLFGSMGDRPLASFAGAGWPKGPNHKDVCILIVALDYDALRARFFRSYGTNHGATPDTTPLVEAVHASSDAPIAYFDKPTAWNEYRYWDGAMAGMNNPLLAAIIDLLGSNIPAGEVVALSIGTGTTRLVPTQATPEPPVELAEPRCKPAILADVRRGATCIVDDPPDTATFGSHVILANARGADPTAVCSVVRLSPVVRPVLEGGAWRVPLGLSNDQFQALQKLDMDAVEQPQVELIKALGVGWMNDLIPNQPIRMRSDDLSSSLGEESYSAAKKRWETLAWAG